jgi:hypothetical protein
MNETKILYNRYALYQTIASLFFNFNQCFYLITQKLHIIRSIPNKSLSNLISEFSEMHIFGVSK